MEIRLKINQWLGAGASFDFAEENNNWTFEQVELWLWFDLLMFSKEVEKLAADCSADTVPRTRNSGSNCTSSIVVEWTWSRLIDWMMFNSIFLPVIQLLLFECIN